MTRHPRMGAAERWKVPLANLQKAKRIGDSRRSLALARRCTVLEKLPHVNFLIHRDLGELAGRHRPNLGRGHNDAGATHTICGGQSYRERIRRDREAGRIARPEGGRVVSGNPAGVNGKSMTADEMQRLIDRADSDKLRKARERLLQAQESEEKRKE